ncbi:MAG TPA: hypothetical protein PLE18_14000 [Candidatus Sumerlaeota bacterium]|nr:hypothetical protein [Candidatus Sumerlaeota bacterium]
MPKLAMIYVYKKGAHTCFETTPPKKDVQQYQEWAMSEESIDYAIKKLTELKTKLVDN